jgi:hypothetical protein
MSEYLTTRTWDEFEQSTGRDRIPQIVMEDSMDTGDAYPSTEDLIDESPTTKSIENGQLLKHQRVIHVFIHANSRWEPF